MNERIKNAYKPGSDEAIAAGCECPVLDNNHGQGRETSEGTLYWMTQGCPIHWKPEVEHD